MTLSTQTRQTHNPIDTSDTTATPSTTSEAPANRVHRGVDTRIQAVIIGVVLAAVSIGVWQLAVTAGWFSDLAPTPARTFSRGVEILSDPFYRDGPGSVGIFWHVITSLRRVLTGFFIATVVAIPLGFVLGRSTALRWAVDPLMQVLRPVSPLAWLPLGLALLSNAEHTAIFVIVLSALWPTLINTIDAVRNVNHLHQPDRHPGHPDVGAHHLHVVSRCPARHCHGPAHLLVYLVVGDHRCGNARRGPRHRIFRVEPMEPPGH